MDEYQILRVLRQAIYGKVLLARHKPTKELCAIKMMSNKHMLARKAIVGPSVKENGETEINLLSFFQKDQHPHILHLKTTFTYCDYRCLVLDFCPFGELFDRLEIYPEHRIPLPLVMEYFQQIVSGVHYLHSKQIAHRDLSLENILIDVDQKCRICDFGLAVRKAGLCTERVGKSFYMPPEVYDSIGPYSGYKADMWSLAIILFIMATGVPPLESPTSSDARFQLIKEEGIFSLIKAWKMDLFLPDELIALLSKLFVVNPNRRLSINELISDPLMLCSVDSNQFLCDPQLHEVTRELSDLKENIVFDDNQVAELEDFLHSQDHDNCFTPSDSFAATATSSLSSKSLFKAPSSMEIDDVSESILHQIVGSKHGLPDTDPQTATWTSSIAQYIPYFHFPRNLDTKKACYICVDTAATDSGNFARKKRRESIIGSMFGPFSKKYHKCRQCNERVCSSCSQHRTAILHPETDMSHFRVKKRKPKRVCDICYEHNVNTEVF